MLTRKSSWLFSLTLLCGLQLHAQGLVVNEFSNGASLSKEYVELIVIGAVPVVPPCPPIDIRNWIIDDNNGDFSCGACSNRGIATGHMRFGNQAVWSAVPQGSMIVIYNANDIHAGMPAADPNDTAPADGVYIVPSNHASLEASTSPCAFNIPSAGGNCGACSGNIAYTGVCYTAGFANAWDNCNLRNTGDAMQVRMPNGAYFHGLANDAGSLGMTGGVDNLLFNATLTGNAVAFTNSLGDGNFRNIGNFTIISSTVATPGLPNTAANSTWINTFLGCSILPVTYAEPLAAQAIEQANQLTWTTAKEANCSHFSIERAASPDGEFLTIGQANGAGNSSSSVRYTFLDAHPLTTSYYRLAQVDLDGNVVRSEVVTLTRGGSEIAQVSVWPHPTGDQLHYNIQGEGILEISLLDGMGRVIYRRGTAGAPSTIAGSISLQDYSEGVYFLQVRSEQGILREKIVHLR